MIYEKVTGGIGTDLAEFLEWHEKKFVPYADRLGVRLLGLWIAITGQVRTFMEIWVFEDFTEYERLSKAFRSPKTEEDKQIMKDLPKYHIGSRVELLQGTSLSPSKGILEQKRELE